VVFWIVTTEELLLSEVQLVRLEWFALEVAVGLEDLSVALLVVLEP
jgi:hypothetical protein